MKIMKWVSLVTQHYKKMHNVHAVDVFQFYNLDFLILFFADDFLFPDFDSLACTCI